LVIGFLTNWYFVIGNWLVQSQLIRVSSQTGDHERTVLFHAPNAAIAELLVKLGVPINARDVYVLSLPEPFSQSIHYGIIMIDDDDDDIL
jgi:hypothetical protein